MPKQTKSIQSLHEGRNDSLSPKDWAEFQAVELRAADVSQYGIIKKLADEVSSNLMAGIGSARKVDIIPGDGLHSMSSDFSWNKIRNSSFAEVSAGGSSTSPGNATNLYYAGTNGNVTNFTNWTINSCGARIFKSSDKFAFESEKADIDYNMRKGAVGDLIIPTTAVDPISGLSLGITDDAYTTLFNGKVLKIIDWKANEFTMTINVTTSDSISSHTSTSATINISTYKNLFAVMATAINNHNSTYSFQATATDGLKNTRVSGVSPATNFYRLEIQHNADGGVYSNTAISASPSTIFTVKSGNSWELCWFGFESNTGEAYTKTPSNFTGGTGGNDGHSLKIDMMNSTYDSGRITVLENLHANYTLSGAFEHVSERKFVLANGQGSGKNLLLSYTIEHESGAGTVKPKFVIESGGAGFGENENITVTDTGNTSQTAT